MAKTSKKFYCYYYETETGLVVDVADTIGRNSHGEGVDGKDIDQAIKGAGDVTFRIASTGGDFYEALKMYSSIRRHPGTTTAEVVSIAYSAATIVALACDRVLIEPHATWGIHSVWAHTSGNAKELEGTIAWLKKADEQLTNIYQVKTGKSEKQIRDWMEANGKDGTVWTGQEAVDVGFADGLIEHQKLTVSQRREQLHAFKDSLGWKREPPPRIAAEAKSKPAKQLTRDERWKLLRQFRREEKQRRLEIRDDQE